MKKGTVLRIERISPDDGIGLRTVIFLKGCPLRCAWCSTPESHKMAPEWYYMQSKCRHCGLCLKTCPNGALRPSEDGTAVVRDPEKCVNCFQCAAVCLTHAIGIFGEEMTIDQIMKEINKDRLYYFYSNGGVTLSGGDILMQADFAREILKECREIMIDTAAEMDLYGSYENVAKLLPYLNRYFVDLKVMDPEMHKKWTGVSNETILSNIMRAGTEYPDTPLTVRMPIIPGVNDSEENIMALAGFCSRIPACRMIEFLPYHRLGSAKYRYIGKEYRFENVEPMSEEEAEEKISCLRGHLWPFAVTLSGREIVPATRWKQNGTP